MAAKQTKKLTTKRLKKGTPQQAEAPTQDAAAPAKEQPAKEQPAQEQRSPAVFDAPPVEAQGSVPAPERAPEVEAPIEPPVFRVLPGPSQRGFGRGEDWVPVVYEGTIVTHAEAGVFVRGTRTRLRPTLATQLLGIEGFRIAC